MDGLPILFRDEHYVAVNKPAGLFVHRTRLAERGAQYALQLVRDQLGQRVNPVHRLDRPTAGVLLFALHKEATRRACQAFSEGRVTKRYLAVVRGYLDGQGTIDYPLGEKGAIAAVRKAAITDYEGMATVELPIPIGRYQTARYSLVALYPRTGRRHQLRRHLAHIFHPIIGDTTHGEGRHNRLMRNHFAVDGLLLFAQSLMMTHPLTGHTLTVDAPLPGGMQRLFTAFGWEHCE